MKKAVHNLHIQLNLEPAKAKQNMSEDHDKKTEQNNILTNITS